MPDRTPPTLTLLVPGLHGPLPPAGVDPAAALAALLEPLPLPALESLLGRARALPGAGDSIEGRLCTLFGIDRPSGGDWPVAALMRIAEGAEGAADAWHLRVDPVHLEADLADLVLRDGASLDLAPDEAAALTAALDAHFADRGLRFEPLAPARWYLALADAPRLTTTELSRVVGRALRAHLPAGPDAARWHALLNEVQMVLHASPVNAAREARGAPAVNSVWPWGGGRRPAPGRAGWGRVWCDSPLGRGLAALAQTPCEAVPADAAAWLDRAGPGAHLLVLEAGAAAARASDVGEWQAFVTAFEASWAAPLLGAFRGGRLARLDLLADAGPGASVRRADRWRVWRRPRGLAAWLASVGA